MVERVPESGQITEEKEGQNKGEKTEKLKYICLTFNIQ